MIAQNVLMIDCLDLHCFSFFFIYNSQLKTALIYFTNSSFFQYVLDLLKIWNFEAHLLLIENKSLSFSLFTPGWQRQKYRMLQKRCVKYRDIFWWPPVFREVWA